MLDTQDRIIYAAMRVFSYHSYEEASIRQIAREAKVSISSILDLYQSKEKLYRAVFQHMRPRQKYLLGETETLTCEEAKYFLTNCLAELVDGVCDVLEEGQCPRILFFGFFASSPLFERYCEGIFRERDSTLPKLFMVLTGNNDRQKACSQALRIVKHLAVFPMEFVGSTKRLSVIGFSEERVRELKTSLIRYTFSLLGVEPPYAFEAALESAGAAHTGVSRRFLLH